MFTTVRDTRSTPFVLMVMGNTMENRIDVCNLYEKYFFLEKFVYTDIEISENKNQLGILD